VTVGIHTLDASYLRQDFNTVPLSEKADEFSCTSH
jgi:hypothetical protein